MTEILRFEMNVPAEVTLKHAGPGKPIEGRYGNRVMYTLADDRVMYVAPIVASRITDLGIQPGEVFHVRKQVKTQGRQRLIEWQVERLASESETQLERELRESIEVAQAAKTAHPSRTEGSEEPNSHPLHVAQEQVAQLSTTTDPAVVPVLTGSSNGDASSERNGNRSASVTAKRESTPIIAPSTADNAGTESGCIQEPAVPSTPAAAPAVVSVSNGSANRSSSPVQKNGHNAPPITTKLEHALKTAISAAYNAEKYGAELGYAVRFDADAIKSMAITVLINMSEGNRR